MRRARTRGRLRDISSASPSGGSPARIKMMTDFAVVIARPMTTICHHVTSEAEEAAR